MNLSKCTTIEGFYCKMRLAKYKSNSLRTRVLMSSTVDLKEKTKRADQPREPQQAQPAWKTSVKQALWEQGLGSNLTSLEYRDQFEAKRVRDGSVLDQYIPLLQL